MFQRKSIFFLLFIFLCSGLLGSSSTLLLPLKSKVGQSLKTGDGILEIKEMERKLNRSRLSYEELHELKWMMLHWRFQLKNRFIAQSKYVSGKEQLSLLNKLDQLEITLTREDLLQLQKTLSTPSSLFNALVEEQGNPELTEELLGYSKMTSLSGPSILPIKPIERSQWPYEEWVQLTEQANYFRDEWGRPYFRGHFFEVGDILLVNQKTFMEGTFNLYTDGPSSYTHSAVYVEMMEGGISFPAVLEVYQQGVRLLPLNAFLGDHFIHYAQIYRVKGGIKDFLWKKEVEAAVRDLVAMPHGYNMYGDEAHTDGDRYLTCTQLIKAVYRRAYHPLTTIESPLTRPVQELVESLDHSLTSLLTPTSFAADASLELIGTLDGGIYLQNIVYELILTKLNQVINKGEIDISSLQETMEYKMIKLVLQTPIPLLTPIMIQLLGDFDKGANPIGPPALVALMPPLDKEIGKMREKLESDLGEYIRLMGKKESLFSFSELSELPMIRNKLEEVVSSLKKRHYSN